MSALQLRNAFELPFVWFVAPCSQLEVGILEQMAEDMAEDLADAEKTEAELELERREREAEVGCGFRV